MLNGTLNFRYCWLMTITGHKTIWTCPQKHKSYIHMKTGFFNLAISMKFSLKCLKWLSGIFFHVFAITSSFTSKRRVVLHEVYNIKLWRWILVSWKGCFCKRWCNSPNSMCFSWAGQTLIFGNFTQVIKMFLCIGFFILQYILRIALELPGVKI